MKVIELIIDKDSDGIDAISMVDRPAIEENFIALSEELLTLAEVSEEKRLLMGAALIPNKKIYRKDPVTDEEYYIFFSEKTVRQASELFFINANQSEATIQHQAEKVKGMTVVESWIIENSEKDKSSLYGLNLPVGTWMISMKCHNEEVYAKAKKGEIKGFSIEGYFADREEQELLEAIKQIVQLESYTDYPQQATENAKIALRYAEENGWGSCGTPVGKARANQLANREPISEETIARMASFERQRQNSDKPLGEGCGRLMWLAWGGDAGIEWASKKLKQIRNNG